MGTRKEKLKPSVFMKSGTSKMRCYICDVILHPYEIEVHPKLGTYEPCSKCRLASFDTDIEGEDFDNSELSEDMIDDDGEFV